MTEIESIHKIAVSIFHTEFIDLSADSKRNVIEIQRNQIMERGLEIQEKMIDNPLFKYASIRVTH